MEIGRHLFPQLTSGSARNKVDRIVRPRLRAMMLHPLISILVFDICLGKTLNNSKPYLHVLSKVVILQHFSQSIKKERQHGQKQKPEGYVELVCCNSSALYLQRMKGLQVTGVVQRPISALGCYASAWWPRSKRNALHRRLRYFRHSTTPVVKGLISNCSFRRT